MSLPHRTGSSPKQESRGIKQHFTFYFPVFARKTPSDVFPKIKAINIISTCPFLASTNLNHTIMLNKIVKYTFKQFGFRISRIQEELTMEGALKRCTNRGLKVNSVIDVGASDGRWSKSCMDFLPDSNYLLVEAQDAHRNSLEKFNV